MLFPLYIFVLCFLPNVINVSCVHTRIYLVVFVMYILSYCYLYVLSRVMVSYTISVNKTMLGSSLSQMFDSFVCILCWTTLSIMFQFYWWRKRRSTRRNHRLIESQLPTLSHNNYITSVFHWNVTIWLVWSGHMIIRDVSHPNETQIQTCTCLHDDVRCKQSMA